MTREKKTTGGWSSGKSTSSLSIENRDAGQGEKIKVGSTYKEKNSQGNTNYTYCVTKLPHMEKEVRYESTRRSLA